MLTIVVWDVQHGSAAYIKTPNGKHIVIDLGVGSHNDNNETFSPLLHLKANWDVNQLDEVIITHPHTDHIDDIFNFYELSPKVLLRPKHLNQEDIRKANRSEDSDKVDKYLEINDSYKYPVSDSENPALPENNGDVNIKTFLPTSCGTSNINNHSVVTVIEYLGIKVIIPGDNEPPSWKELLEKNDFVEAIKNARILVAPHHGRESGYCKELFEHFEPNLVIVSDGRFCDTSAVSRYSSLAKGWEVQKRSGNSEQRKCLTTRSDGEILIKIGKNPDDTTFMEVTID
ncbi:hypothetical protein JCM14036_03320 [Desulfotomaculum defluvii]